MKHPITLSYPDKRLSPNARMNRFALAKVKQEARDEGFYAAKEAGLNVADQPLQMFIKICPPDKRKRDGIFDALDIDDSQAKVSSHGFGDVVPGGKVYIWIEPLEKIPEWLEA